MRLVVRVLGAELLAVELARLAPAAPAPEPAPERSVIEASGGGHFELGFVGSDPEVRTR